MHTALTTEFVGELLHPTSQEMVCAAVKVELLQRIPPVCIIASTNQNDIRLESNRCWLYDLVKSQTCSSLSRSNCTCKPASSKSVSAYRSCA